MSNKKYEGVDGLRAYSAMGIVLMHVLSNGEYKLNGFIYEQMIPSFTNLVFLFMIVSGFSMCCGYYHKIMNNEISLEKFYQKRYQKIWPYFAILCLLDFVLSPKIESLYEVLANLTLCFGLLPNANISVIGVGWFLGVVFVFYMIFPFFCFLIANKKRAWISFGLSLIFNELCTIYFNTGRNNIIYCLVFFVAGGLIFLYKDQLISKKWRFLSIILSVLFIVAYYIVDAKVIIMLCLFSCMLICAINVLQKGVLNNPFTNFLSGISMEVYLSHMVIYRVLEKLHMVHFFESELVSFVVMSLGTIAGTIIFSVIMNSILNKVYKFVSSFKTVGK